MALTRLQVDHCPTDSSVPASASDCIHVDITEKMLEHHFYLSPQVKQVLHSKVSRSFTEYRAIAGKSFIDPRDLTKVSRVDEFVR